MNFKAPGPSPLDPDPRLQQVTANCTQSSSTCNKPSPTTISIPITSPASSPTSSPHVLHLNPLISPATSSPASWRDYRFRFSSKYATSRSLLCPSTNSLGLCRSCCCWWVCKRWIWVLITCVVQSLKGPCEDPRNNFKELYLQNNQSNGFISPTLSNCSHLVTLDLGFNFLTGTIMQV